MLNCCQYVFPATYKYACKQTWRSAVQILLTALSTTPTTEKPRAECNYKPYDSEDTFKDQVWMTRMCRMYMLATTANIHHMLSDYHKQDAIHLCRCAHACTFCVHVAVDLSCPLLCTCTGDTGDITDTLKEGKKSTCGHPPELHDPGGSKVRPKRAPGDRRWDAQRCNIIMGEIGAKPWTKSELWVDPKTL